MKKIIIAMMVLCTVQSSVIAQDKKLIADETWAATTEKTLKITSSGEEITKYLINKFEDSLSYYVVKYKTDRKGRYKETTLYLPLLMMPDVMRYVQELNRNKEKIRKGEISLN